MAQQKDRRQEFKVKAQQLQNTQSELQQKNTEMQSTAGNSAPAPIDGRQRIQEQMTQLNDIHNQLQQQAITMSNKKDAGADGINTAPVEKLEKIDGEKIKKIREIYEKYQTGKANFDKRIIGNYEWWKLRHYGDMSTKESAQNSENKDKEPPSAWLFNSIVNKHADIMDNFPTVSCLPIEEQDREEASKLSKIVPIVIESNNYEDVYSKCGWYKLICGASCKQIVWDNDKMNGLGDVAINKVDLLNIAWEPGVTDIQKSPYFFHRTLMKNDMIINLFGEKVPELKGKLGNNGEEVSKWVHDDNIDTTDCSMVYDCYYKVHNSSKKTIVHLIKYVDDVVLFASANLDEYKETGYYHHGKYPFVIEPLFPMEGTPIGFGYVDIMKNAQKVVDELDAAFLKNIKASSRKRFVVNNQGGINPDDLANFDKDVVEASGTNLDEGNFRTIETRPLDSICETFRQNKIEEIKQTSNNRDVSNGSTGSGVTAASAIAALQEAGSKTSRDELKASYRAFKDEVYLVIELIRQFYDETRYFRIIGEYGETEFISYNNKNIKSDGNDSRMPVFDISVKPQKSSAYSRLSQNELMLQLFGAGVFNPQMADQAVMLIENMDFEGKDALLQKISQNGTMLQKITQYQSLLLAMAQQLDSVMGTQYLPQVQQAIASGEIGLISMSLGNMSQKLTDSLGGVSENGNKIVDRAREQSRSRTEVS